MKQIVSSPPKTFEIISVKDVYPYGDTSIVAYITNRRNGMGILVRDPKGDREWGFRYHSQIIQGNLNPCTYISTTARESMEKCLQSGRALYLFDTFAEYIKFAADNLTSNEL